MSYTYPTGQRANWFTKTNVSLASREHTLYDISTMLYGGEIVALLGPNGAGKSTLLRTLNGLVRPQQGEVRVCGRSVRRCTVAEMAQFVGYVPQRPERLFFCSTVAEELMAGPRALGLETATKGWRTFLVEVLDLAPLLARSPYALSGGQQRRVALASVLAARPQVVVLDEPTSGLDAHARIVLVTLLQKLAAAGTGVVFATHDVEFAELVASRWLVLVEGQIIADDTPMQILSNATVLTKAAIEPTVSYQLDRYLSRYVSRAYPA